MYEARWRGPLAWASHPGPKAGPLMCPCVAYPGAGQGAYLGAITLPSPKTHSSSRPFQKRNVTHSFLIHLNHPAQGKGGREW